MTNGPTTAPSQIVQKLWNYCNVLPAYAEQRAAGRCDDLSAYTAQAGGMSYQLTCAGKRHYLSTALRTGVEQLSWSVLSSGGDVGHVCDTVAMTGWFQ